MFETENKALKLKSSIVQIGLKDKIKLLKGKVVLYVFMANMIVTMCLLLISGGYYPVLIITFPSQLLGRIKIW